MVVIVAVVVIVIREPIYLNLQEYRPNAEERPRQSGRARTLPHVQRLQRVHRSLIQLLPPVIGDIVQKMQQNDSLNDEQINRIIDRLATPEEAATMLLMLLQTEPPERAFDVFIQALRALQFEDILALVEDNRIDALLVV